MKINSLPPVKYLKECFDYDGENLVWKRRPNNHFQSISKQKRHNNLVAGKVAGTIDRAGYKVVRLTYKGEHKSYRVHRIVYAMNHGDTDLLVDHINGDRQDNRIVNLRAVESRVNVSNQHNSDRTGLKGAHWDKEKGRWLANIKFNYKSIFLGRFDTEQEAHDAYNQAALSLNT